MNFLRNAVNRFVILTVLRIAPLKCLTVQICDIPKRSPNNEVLFHESDEPLYSPFSEWMPWLTKLGLKPDDFHEGFVIFLPYGISCRIPSDHDTLHIVGENSLRDTHIDERMDHSDEEILLLGIWKELNIPLSAMMTDHCEAGTLISVS